MSVFVEWKWKEKTKSFLVVFHFYDDFSKPNLRIKNYEKGYLYVSTPFGLITPMKAWMTWSPSHPELALLTELLSYANIINGLKEFEKRHLRTNLDPVITDDDELGITADVTSIENEIGKDKKTVVYLEKPEYPTEQPLHCCAELCPEYIYYLKKVLKPYLKD